MTSFRTTKRTKSRTAGAMVPAVALLIGGGLALGTAPPVRAQAAPFLDTPTQPLGL